MTGAAKTPLGRLTQGNNTPRKRPGRGRVTKLTPELSKRICDAVRAGNYMSVAARFCGVSEGTVADWLARGRGDHPTRSASKIYVEFAQDVDAAEAGAEVAAVLHWRAAMPKDWHASEKWLIGRVPQRWAPTQGDGQGRSAYAGVNVNIGIAGGSSSDGPTNVTLRAPLQTLLEDNPELIAGTMQFLDQLLPVATPDEEVPGFTGQYPESGPIVDAEPGSWREVGPEAEDE